MTTGARIPRQYLLLAGAVLLVSALAVLFVTWTDEVISRSLWFVVWYLGLVLEAVPQGVYWALFLLMAALVALAGVVRRQPRGPAAGVESRPATGSIQQLARRIRRASEGSYYRWLLAHDLGDLLMEAEFGPGLGAAERRQQWQAGRAAEVPPAVRAYVEAGQERGFWAAMQRHRRGQESLPGQREGRHPLDLDLEVIVEFLENRVEVENDRRRG